MGHEEHRHEAPRRISVYVVTASDTRGYRVVKDEPAQIRAALAAAAEAGADAVLVNGGTGIAGRDRTYEAVAGLLEKRLDGFGELFRMLSYAEIGSAAMLSRAVGGVWGGRAVFSVPGSRAAVRLAWEKLLAPELGHVVRELRKDAGR
jgi:molybdenum cofactor biosynthesis protein B